MWKVLHGLCVANRLFDYGSRDPVAVIVQGLNSVGGAEENVVSEDMLKTQYEMVQMFGAAMASSKVSQMIYCISSHVVLCWVFIIN